MFYTGEVSWYDSDEDIIMSLNVVVCGENYCEAVERITEYFGEYETNSLRLEPFAPGNLITFDSADDKQLKAFCHLRELKDSIIW